MTLSHWSPWSVKGVSISQLIIHDKEGFDGSPRFSVSTKDERLLLDLIFHKVKLGILSGLNVKKMEFRDIPVEIFGKAVRGKG